MYSWMSRHTEEGMEPCIVIVEDEPELLELLCDCLQLEGFCCVGADHPERIPSVLRDVEPELFLVDVMLPGMTGMELAEHLRAHGFAEAPMIAMSASESLVQIAARSGLFQETINKPFDIEDLIASVERHLGSRPGPAYKR